MNVAQDVVDDGEQVDGPDLRVLLLLDHNHVVMLFRWPHLSQVVQDQWQGKRGANVGQAIRRRLGYSAKGVE